MRYVVTLIMVLVLFACTGKDTPTARNTVVKPELFISLKDLEHFGFEHIDAANFNILFIETTPYILNTIDNMVVKYPGDEKILKYKASGQGPGEFIRSRSIFKYDTKTIAIFDITKSSILFFDLDLNFIKETKILPYCRKIYHTSKANEFIAFGDFGPHVFALLDGNFTVANSFIEANTRTSFKNVFPSFINMGYILDGTKIAHTSWLYITRECQVDIYTIPGKKKINSLSWTQSHNPTQKNIDESTDQYASYLVVKTGDYVVVFNKFFKTIPGKSVNDLMVFDNNGQCVYRNEKFPYDLIQCCNSPGEPRIFVQNETDGIGFIEIDRLLK